MDYIQERQEHYEAQDRERQKREDEIMRLDIKLVVYAGSHAIQDDDYRLIYLQRNAMILDYGKTYGTKAQERLREMLDESRKEFIARAQELEDHAIYDMVSRE